MPTETSGTTEDAFYRLSVGFSTVRQQTPLSASEDASAIYHRDALAASTGRVYLKLD
jgi:hypothetical protein